MAAKYNPAAIEEVKLLKPTRVKEHGEDKAKVFEAGKIVKVSGNDKAQLLASGHGAIVVPEVKTK